MMTLMTIMLAMLFPGVQDQVYQPEESAVLYYSPKTSIVFDFTYTEEILEKGIYAEYAEELLGITDVIGENKSIYTLQGVNIKSRALVDLSRPHKVVAETGIPLQFININEKGLLIGYNLPYRKNTHAKQTRQEDEIQNTELRTKVPPFSDEIIEASTLDEQAQLVAKQIMHIREMRTYILTGEVEHSPADGLAMQLVLAELDKQEQELIALFTGTKKSSTKHYQSEYCPAGNDSIIEQQLYFSTENGFTDAENVDAKKIDIYAICQHQYMNNDTSEETKAEKKEKKKKREQLSQIIYNIPGNASISVSYQGLKLNEKIIPIAQFGIDMPFPKDIFSGTELPIIVISEKTGNVISVSK